MKPSDWPPLDGIPENALQLFVIFAHPLDFPNHYVVRRQFGVRWVEGMPGTPPDPDDPEPVVQDVMPRLAISLAEARSFVPMGLYRQPRQEGEDPFIVECWF